MFCPKCGKDVAVRKTYNNTYSCISCNIVFNVDQYDNRIKKIKNLPIVTTEGLGFAETIERPEDIR